MLARQRDSLRPLKYGRCHIGIGVLYRRWWKWITEKRRRAENENSPVQPTRVSYGQRNLSVAKDYFLGAKIGSFSETSKFLRNFFRLLTKIYQSATIIGANSPVSAAISQVTSSSSRTSLR